MIALIKPTQLCCSSVNYYDVYCIIPHYLPLRRKPSSLLPTQNKTLEPEHVQIPPREIDRGPKILLPQLKVVCKRQQNVARYPPRLPLTCRLTLAKGYRAFKIIPSISHPIIYSRSLPSPNTNLTNNKLKPLLELLTWVYFFPQINLFSLLLFPTREHTFLPLYLYPFPLNICNCTFVIRI